MQGDQLWVKIIGPASCGKSTLCEALSVSKKYVLAKSTIRGFHSGFKTDKEGTEDNSLIAKLDGKTLVTKDGDTLLQSPNLPQILSEARDVYDTNTRTNFKNAIDRSYENIRITWILCGTNALRQIDSSELGERFLDCVIMNGIDEDLEDEVLDRVVHKAFRNLAFQAGEGEDRADPNLIKAMQLTGGYLGYLREQATELYSSVEVTPEAIGCCKVLGKFVAHMRARPSKKQEETAEREFSARLAIQLARLAGCLTIVLQKKTTDEEVLYHVTKVAFDTARGRTLNIVDVVHRFGEEGVSSSGIASTTGHGEDKERIYIKFLKQIGVLEVYHKQEKGVQTRAKWRLTPKFNRVYSKLKKLAQFIEEAKNARD
jgi:hypothetical protein